MEQDHPHFLAQLRAVILDGASRGHYRLTQDVPFLVAWDLAGRCRLRATVAIGNPAFYGELWGTFRSTRSAC